MTMENIDLKFLFVISLFKRERTQNAISQYKIQYFLSYAKYVVRKAKIQIYKKHVINDSI